MSYQEKKSLVSLVGSLLISVLYFFFVYRWHVGASAAGTVDLFRFWGTVMLLFIPVQVVLRIIVEVIFVIANVIATRRTEPDITDEFDRLIELKAVRNFAWVFSGGFFLAMGTQVIRMTPNAMFLTLAATLVLVGITLDLSQFLYYRRGV